MFEFRQSKLSERGEKSMILCPFHVFKHETIMWQSFRDAFCTQKAELRKCPILSFVTVCFGFCVRREEILAQEVKVRHASVCKNYRAQSRTYFLCARALPHVASTPAKHTTTLISKCVEGGMLYMIPKCPPWYLNCLIYMIY